MKTTSHITFLDQAADVLIDNLLASEDFIRYREASARLEADQQAKNLLEQLAQMQTEIRKKQANNSLTQIDIDALHGLQAQVQRNNTITAYAQAQQAAVGFLREINNEISQLLGINFASFASKKTC